MAYYSALIIKLSHNVTVKISFLLLYSLRHAETCHEFMETISATGNNGWSGSLRLSRIWARHFWFYFFHLLSLVRTKGHNQPVGSPPSSSRSLLCEGVRYHHHITPMQHSYFCRCWSGGEPLATLCKIWPVPDLNSRVQIFLTRGSRRRLRQNYVKYEV